MIQINKLPPFKQMCCTIGNLPTSFMESMTYYEALEWLYKYLSDTIIPTINTTNDAVTELQGLFTQLQSYVDNYFNNLDVQEEINNKLDEMAESGQLTNIIKDYVDPIFEDFSTQMNNEFTSFSEQVTGQIDYLNDKVNNIESGDPIPVASTSDMTDTTKIYLNTTDGKWYYHNGTTWVAGGNYLTGELSGYSMRGILKNRIYPDTHAMSFGGWSASTGASTSTNTRFKNYVYIRNCLVIKNPDPNYTLVLHKYTINSSAVYTHIDNDTLDITDNNYHYINFQNANYFRVVVVDAGGQEIPSSSYETIFNNLEFYTLDKDPIVPEELIGGGIYNITNTTNAGKIQRTTDDFNLSHYVMKPIQATKDTIVEINFKTLKTKQNVNFGIHLVVYNSDKYPIQNLRDFKQNVKLILKQGYYLAVVFYGSNDTRYDRFDINDFIEIKTSDLEINKNNKYIVPCIVQHQRIMNYNYTYGLTCQGFTSDSNYFYVSGLVNGADDRAKIFKINVNDLEDITISNERQYGHANGLAKVGDQIAITSLSNGTIHFINASDLSDEGSINAISVLASNGFKLGKVSNLAYNSTYNTYCLYGPKYDDNEDPTITAPSYLPKHFVLTDSNFNIIKDIEIISPRNVTSSIAGGCYLFDNMIALTVYENGTNTNKVVFYDWHGNMITHIDVPYTTEIEGITCIGDTYYLLFNNSYQGFAIYEIKAAVFRLMENDNIINDFISADTSIVSDIAIATNQYLHLYNEITNTAGTGDPVDWF